MLVYFGLENKLVKCGEQNKNCIDVQIVCRLIFISFIFTQICLFSFNYFLTKANILQFSINISFGSEEPVGHFSVIVKLEDVGKVQAKQAKKDHSIFHENRIMIKHWQPTPKFSECMPCFASFTKIFKTFPNASLVIVDTCCKFGQGKLDCFMGIKYVLLFIKQPSINIFAKLELSYFNICNTCTACVHQNSKYNTPLSKLRKQLSQFGKQQVSCQSFIMIPFNFQLLLSFPLAICLFECQAIYIFLITRCILLIP